MSMFKFYKCPKCESKFYTSFKYGEDGVNGRKRFVCDNCGFEHAEPVNLLNHLSNDDLYKEACDYFNGRVSDIVKSPTTQELLDRIERLEAELRYEIERLRAEVKGDE